MRPRRMSESGNGSAVEALSALQTLDRSQGLHPSAPSQRAARRLLNIVDELARQPIRTQDGNVFRLSDNDRDEIVGSVVLKILERNPLDRISQPAELASWHHGAERAVRAYLKAMIANTWRSEQRRCLRERRSAARQGLESRFVDDLAPGPDYAPAVTLKQLSAVFRRAVEHALMHRHPRYRKQLEVMWGWFQAYAFDGATSDAFGKARPPQLAALAPGDNLARAHAQWRQARRRFRAAIESSLLALGAVGELTVYEVALGQRACQVLLAKRHISLRSASTPTNHAFSSKRD